MHLYSLSFSIDAVFLITIKMWVSNLVFLSLYSILDGVYIEEYIVC